MSLAEGSMEPTWVAVALTLEAFGDAEEGAVALGARVVVVRQPLALGPAHQQQLREQQRRCGEHADRCGEDTRL